MVAPKYRSQSPFPLSHFALAAALALLGEPDRAVQRRLVADLVSESLIRGNCPVDAVVISTSGKGDRPV